jgi:DNA polymerase II small subunit
MKPILKLFSEHGTFVQPEAISYISSKENPAEFSSLIIKNLMEYPLVLTIEEIKKIEQLNQSKDQKKLSLSEMNRKDAQTKMMSTIYNGNISEEIFEENNEAYDDKGTKEEMKINAEENEEERIPKAIEIKKIEGWKPFAKEYDSEIGIIKDITGNSTSGRNANDFAKLFVNRYKIIRKILQSQRREMANIIPINRIKKSMIKEIQLIGIVKDVRTTSNGHKLIEIEDETGVAVLLVLKDNHDLMQTANEVVFDEIIGIRGTVSKNGDLIILKSVVFPDISMQHNKNKSDVPLCTAFLSDIHLGSKMFLQDEWQTFLKWVNGNIGNSRQRDVASKLKYIVIPGDTVDGIGIYPGQEKELEIKDIYRQYKALAEQLRLIPEHISIIMQPGNHDAVRPAEPQPTFEKEIQDLFSGVDITFVGNPCYLSLHGVEIVSYHGQSLLDFATNIHNLQYNKPVEIMKNILKKRHLAPTYGGYTPLAPEHNDYMIIDRVPDIFVTGHVHISAINNYRGITLINASAWQAQTSYQKMLNFIPDPAKLPIVNLRSGNATSMDFSRKI